MKTKDRDIQSYFAIIDKFLQQAELNSTECLLLGNELKRYVINKFEGQKYIPPIITKFCTELYREFYRLIDFKDPYKSIKNISNTEAKKIISNLPSINFEDAIKISVFGNQLDYGSTLVLNPDLDMLRKSFLDFKNIKFFIDDIEELRENIIKSKSVLFLVDNAGEVFFDIPFLKEIGKYLPKEKIFIGAKEYPMLNDSTFNELKDLNFEQYGTLISTGSNCFGLHEEDVSIEFKKILKNADLIIAKGQAYLEFFTEYNFTNVFNIARIKYPIINNYINILECNQNVVIFSKRYCSGGKPYNFGTLNCKVIDKKSISELVYALKNEGKKIVTTNGSFDILHIGHMRFLEKARSEGDVLIVLINDDNSVKRFKGPSRPINSENERAEQLTFLSMVDYVIIFSEDKPLDLLKEIKPDLHVKGGSFLANRILEEKNLLESWGGKFKTFEMEDVYSTTNVINKISQTNNNLFNSELLDRKKLKILPLMERKSKSDLSVIIPPMFDPPKVDESTLKKLEYFANIIKKAKENKRPIIIAYGAHLIKNGLSLILIDLIKKGFVQHLFTNGAGTIHDWEFAFHGKTEEDVKKNLEAGQFGLWDETGYYMNEVINQGARNNKGYGESLGKFISDGLLNENLVEHKNKKYSVLCNAYESNIKFSVAPGFGQDIIHTHPSFNGALFGTAADIDFLKFAKTLIGLEGGVFISIGSAIVAPMVFEKAISMAKNINFQEGKPLNNFDIIVNDIQPEVDWSTEPLKNNPTYYLRFFKTFSRVGGNSHYICLDNRAFLINLYKMLIK